MGLQQLHELLRALRTIDADQLTSEFRILDLGGLQQTIQTHQHAALATVHTIDEQLEEHATARLPAQNHAHTLQQLQRAALVALCEALPFAAQAYVMRLRKMGRHRLRIVLISLRLSLLFTHHDPSIFIAQRGVARRVLRRRRNRLPLRLQQ